VAGSEENVLTVRDVIAVMEAWAPPGFAYGWDRVGLRIGTPDAPVSRVLATLSVTPDAVKAARKAGAELIVAHHPPMWEPLKTLRTDDPETAFQLEIAQSGIAVYGAHTNLDVVPGGVNTLLAKRLGLADTRLLFPAEHERQVKLVAFVPEEHLAPVRDAVAQAGAGAIGDYTHCTFSSAGIGTFMPGEATNPFSGEKGAVNEEPERKFEVLVAHARLKPVLRALFEAHPYEEVAYDIIPLENADPTIGLGLVGELPSSMQLDQFASHVRRCFEVSHVRLCGGGRRRIRTVAVLGGSGGGLIGDVPAGIDAYVTGDVKYHDAQFAELKQLAVVDAGHQGTEHLIVPALVEYLRQALHTHHPAVRVTGFQEPEPFRVITE